MPGMLSYSEVLTLMDELRYIAAHYPGAARRCENLLLSLELAVERRKQDVTRELISDG